MNPAIRQDQVFILYVEGCNLFLSYQLSGLYCHFVPLDLPHSRGSFLFQACNNHTLHL